MEVEEKDLNLDENSEGESPDLTEQDVSTELPGTEHDDVPGLADVGNEPDGPAVGGSPKIMKVDHSVPDPLVVGKVFGIVDEETGIKWVFRVYSERGRGRKFLQRLGVIE